MQDLIDKLQLKVKSYKHQAEEAVSNYLGLFICEKSVVLNPQSSMHRSFEYRYTSCECINICIYIYINPVCTNVFIIYVK